MTSNDSLISVIVPVYKVESYLDRCVQSIVDQTYRNLEIILVDDGSPDCCPEMCDAWAEKDSRIRVIHKQNGGLSDARNAGMAAVTGEYISFVDSDDWIAPEMMMSLLNRAVETQSDIVSCDALRVWDDGRPNKPMIRVRGDFVMNRTEAMHALIQSSCLIQTVWNKLYKAALAKQVPFPKGIIHEDEFWSWQIIALSTRTATLDAAYYYYYQRSNSIMGDGYTGFPMLVVHAKKQRREYILKALPELADIDAYNLVNTCFYQGVQILKHEKGASRKQYLLELKKTASACKISKDFTKSLRLQKRIQLSCIQHFFRATCIMAKLYGID